MGGFEVKKTFKKNLPGAKKEVTKNLRGDAASLLDTGLKELRVKMSEEDTDWDYVDAEDVFNEIKREVVAGIQQSDLDSTSVFKTLGEKLVEGSKALKKLK